jgi:Fe-S-cluster containining protein
LEKVRENEKEVPLPGDRERLEGAFRCERCGRCCTSGLLVELLNPDIDLLLRAMPLRELVDKLVNISGDPARPRFVLRQSRGRCVFYDGALKCAVYETRPLACRAYPRRDDPNCPGSNLEPTSDMLSASRRGHHESLYMSLWEDNYYPESVLSAWNRKNRAPLPNAAGVAGTRPGSPRRRGRRRGQSAAAA